VEGIQRGIQDLENEIAVVKRADLNWPTNVNIAALNNRIAALINERTQLQGKKTVYLNFTHICRVRALSNCGAACVWYSCFCSFSSEK
jgi:hypothetical protein